MRAALKLATLYVSRTLGLFALARVLTRHRLRILAYHSFDERAGARILPQFFISPEVFERRLAYLRKLGVPVLALDQALEGLRTRTLPPCAVAVTIDDGFTGVHRHALPLLRRYEIPATLYVTTYYLQRQTAVFNPAIDYVLASSRARTLDLRALGLPGGTLDVTGRDGRAAASRALVTAADACATGEARSELLARAAEALGVDHAKLFASRRFHIVSAEELRALDAAGIDIQLHTHRHRFSDDDAVAARELEDNRAALSSIVAKPFQHFCYPDGIWSKSQWSVLAHKGIESAVTCQPGLADAGTPRFALPRFLDGDNIRHIEFEAEVSGFQELLRRARARLRPTTRLHPDPKKT
jgi:peptidoglycan/xylan/chitin deacetylase (PgdA/CDA1 family)